jgi:hypothetical protein
MSRSALTSKTRWHLKNAFQPELDDARVNPRGRNSSKGRGTVSPGCRICELGMVKGILKLSSELERMSFPDFGHFVQRDVPVELAGAPENSHSGISKAGSIAVDTAGRRCTKCALVDIDWTTAVSTQPILDSPGGFDGFAVVNQSCEISTWL